MHRLARRSSFTCKSSYDGLGTNDSMCIYDTKSNEYHLGIKRFRKYHYYKRLLKRLCKRIEKEALVYIKRIRSFGIGVWLP